LTQRQNGDWVIRLTVQAIDMHQVIVNAAMGTRFFCTLTELNDDETPVDHVAEARDKWRELGPTKQAGIRCGDPVFWAWLEEEMGCTDVNNHEAAAKIVREKCGVISRSDLGLPGNQEARTRWYNLDFAFQAWRALENA